MMTNSTLRSVNPRWTFSAALLGLLALSACADQPAGVAYVGSPTVVVADQPTVYVEPQPVYVVGRSNYYAGNRPAYVGSRPARVQAQPARPAPHPAEVAQSRDNQKSADQNRDSQNHS
jgi:hypothetical protein